MRTCGLVWGVAAFAWAAPAAASGEMSVATFLSKADALKAKGLGALGSPDVKLLRKEAEAGGAIYRTRLQSDKAAGKPPHSCPPKKSIDEFGSVPKPSSQLSRRRTAKDDYYHCRF